MGSAVRRYAGVGSRKTPARITGANGGGRRFDLASGRTFTPSAQVGVRHDAGDAETGTGIEVGAGAGEGFVVEGAVRTLVAHEESGYEEWGASGSVRIDPGASGRGLALAVAPTWGSTSSGVERLWSLSDAGRVVGDREFEAGRRLDAEVAYGFGLTGARGVVAPYAGLSLADDGARTYRSGARWRLGPGRRCTPRGGSQHRACDRWRRCCTERFPRDAGLDALVDGALAVRAENLPAR